MRPSGSGGAGAPAALALLDDVHRHRLRRAALHLPRRRSEGDPSQFSDRLRGGFPKLVCSQTNTCPFSNDFYS